MEYVDIFDENNNPTGEMIMEYSFRKCTMEDFDFLFELKKGWVLTFLGKYGKIE